MLSRRSLKTVLQSLLSAELLAARGRGNSGARLPTHLSSEWLEVTRIGSDTTSGFGCDSLETLWLASAVNEMFHLHEANGEEKLLSDATFGDWIDRIEAAWRSGVARVTFTTSGTTGQPKRCPHTAEALHVEASFLADLFRDRRRIVSLVPSHHAYGFLFTALLPDVLRVPHLDAVRLDAAELSRRLEPGDLLVTFPDRWRWLERSLRAWPPGVEGVVSTAPCPPDLIESLCQSGLAAMTEVYGSSETAGVAVRRWPTATYQLMPHWRFIEPVHEDLPEIIHQSGPRFPLPDRISHQGRDHFHLAGRLDGAVQVGGINVFPARIAARLSGQPGVHEAAVRLMRSDEGARLKAFIVPEPDADLTALRSDLEIWIGATLPVAERPMMISFGPRLPIGMMSKAADW
ncbi:AMP-binding protein [Methylobacterium flocculans]|uniref:AMP-binding protein n=1 Tax=Methylobacterium flocculans TaxID=2984843 RepID=UPI0021F35E4E|nr:AMP-binding protein [Methylobacterium sp. FF17]